MTGPEVVVGGGIVGLSVALELLRRRPGADVVVLEKESGVGLHQSGHNSGVLHSGVYYAPGSLRARLCVEGGRLLRDFCARRGIPVVSRGKVIVATGDGELGPLGELHRRGVANGVEGLTLVGRDRLADIEPHVCGVAALWGPTAAAVDFA